MREFFVLVNEYPWTTIFLVFGICFILEAIGEAIHGPGNKIIIKDKEDKEE